MRVYLRQMCVRDSMVVIVVVVVDDCQFGVECVCDVRMRVRYVNGFLIFRNEQQQQQERKIRFDSRAKHHNLIVRQYANSMRRFK